MKIGIDARLMYQTGVGVYVRNLILNLASIDRENTYTIFANKQEWAKFTQENHLDASNFELSATNVTWHGWAEQTVFLWQTLSARLDVMHFTYYSFPVLYRRAFVSTVHDLTPLTHVSGRLSKFNPALYKIKRFFLRLAFHTNLSRASKIFVPSNAVKNEILQKYKIANLESKLIVTYEGVNKNLNQNTPPVQAKPKYLLYVGNSYPHKNVSRLLEALDIIGRTISLQLYIVGPNNFFSSNLPETKNVKLFFNVTDAELSQLYAGAAGLVMPSLAEGFGLPVVEAMSFGLPLYLSNLPVFREIAGDAAHYFDPYDPQDIANVILQNTDVSRKTYDISRFSFLLMAKTTLKNYTLCKT